MAKPAIFICQLPMEEEKKREKEVSCGKERARGGGRDGAGNQGEMAD